MCKIKNLFLAFTALIFMAASPAMAEINNDLITKTSFGRSADVQILLGQGADPNAKNTAGLPALFIAAGRSDAESAKIVAALIKAGGNIYLPDKRGNMPIVEAVRNGHPDTVKLLIENKAVMSVKDNRGYDLMKIAELRGDKKVMDYVSDGIENEEAKLGKLQSSDNLKKLVQKYSFDTCANYYIRYYKRDNPEKMDDAKFSTIIDKNEQAREEAKTQMLALFDMKQRDINYIDKETKHAIVQKLDSMLTNDNRLYNNFGQNDDLNKKCKRIAETWDGERFSYVVDKKGRKRITEYK